MDLKIGEMTLGDILDRGMRLLFKRLPAFYAIELVAVAPSLLLELGAPFLPPEAAVGGSLLVAILGIILSLIASAAVLRIIVQEYLDSKVSVGEALQFALGRFLPLFGTSIVAGVLIFLGMLLCFVPGIYLAIVWCLMSQVVVVENISGMQALSRSKSLVQGYPGRVVGLLFLLGLLTVAVTLGLHAGLTAALPFQEIVPVGRGQRPILPGVTNYPNYAVVTIVTTLVNIFLQAYSAICVTFMYFDLRNRKEGYDVPGGFAKIAAWRERSWNDDADAGSPAPQPTGIRELSTVLRPQQLPETDIKEPPSP